MTYRIPLEVTGDLEGPEVLAGIARHFPNLLWGSVEGRPEVTVFMGEPSVAKRTAALCQRIEDRLPGIRVIRVDEELVGLSDIAQRLGVSREAVRMWAHGMRGPGGFPAHRGCIAGGSRGPQRIFAWVDVCRWLADRLGIDADGWEYLTRREVAWLNAYLAGVFIPTPMLATGSP